MYYVVPIVQAKYYNKMFIPEILALEIKYLFLFNFSQCCIFKQLTRKKYFMKYMNMFEKK